MKLIFAIYIFANKKVFQTIYQQFSVLHIKEAIKIKKFIEKQLEYKSVIMRKDNENTIMYPVISLNLKAYSCQNFKGGTGKEMNKACKVKYWVCRPTRFHIEEQLHYDKLEFLEDSHSCLEDKMC